MCCPGTEKGEMMAKDDAESKRNKRKAISNFTWSM